MSKIEEVRLGLDSKEERFCKLIEKRTKCDECDSVVSKGKMRLYNSGENPEMDCGSIGPWTNWNGNLNATIMIVGQDWGTKVYLEKFKEEQKQNTNLPYEMNNTTNNNLASCIKQINPAWDILKLDGIENNSRYPLYFTNEILCYKESKYMNCSIPSSCYEKCIRKYLLEQIEIVQPEVVIFLGSNTFKNFVRSTGKENIICDINLNDKFEDIITSVLDNKIKIEYKTNVGKKIRIFPMWHTGGLGARNAKSSYIKKGGNPENSALQVLEEQWRRMASIMEKEGKV